MSQENVETLRRGYRGVQPRRLDGALAAMHRDIEWKTTRHRHGIAAMTRSGGSRRTWREPFEESMVEPTRWFEHGDRIVVFLRIAGSTRGSDAVAENRVGTSGPCATARSSAARPSPTREALEAAGLSE